MIYNIIVAFALITTPVLSYSTGAPTAVCETLEPQHGGLTSQETPVPYTLQLSSTTADADKPIIITLKGNGDDDTIKGFIIQARINGKPVGRFTAGKQSQAIDCAAPSDTLTHTKILQKINEIDAKWTPNAELKGQNVQFVATVVKQADIFWVKKINSPVQVA